MDKNEKPIISIVTVGMNHLNLIKSYLHSLYKKYLPSVSFELIYVDNCSTDGSIDYIRDNYPLVEIIKNTSIEGFAHNNNKGVKKSKGEYILFLNPDIILLPNCIDNLYNYLKDNKKIGILVPKLLNFDLTPQESIRNFFTVRTLFQRLYLGSEKEGLISFDSEVIQQVDWAIGAAMLLSRDWYDNLKGFDESYFLYVEDVDICLRSWKLGKPVFYFPESVFLHAHQKSSSNGWNRKRFLHIKSMIRFFTIHKIFLKSYSFTN
ncbi:MAG: glycosyltransferase family 2 protein [Fulvivirga sp.]